MTEEAHIDRWRPAQLPSHGLFSSKDIDKIANALGNLSRVGKNRLFTELPVIAYRYEQERQALAEPPFSQQRSQFTKIQNAAEELLRHLFAEGRGQDHVAQSGHFWEMPEVIRAPLERATEIEARTLHQQWLAAGREEPGYDPNFPPLPYPPDTEGQGVYYRSATRLNAAIWAVRLIQRAAAMATDAAARKTKPGKGGDRHKGKTAELILLESLFQLHDDLHRSDSERIEPPSVNTASDGKKISGASFRFAVAYLAVLSHHAPELHDVTDDVIRHRFRDWKKAKSKIQKP